jgi:hypothetical protein
MTHADAWAFGWEALVAIATFVLAAVTVALAWRTSVMANKTADLAEFTKEDVALSRTAIEADVRPALIAVPHNEFVHPRGMNYEMRVQGITRGHPDRAVVYVQDVDGRLFVSVPARNEGAGIAFVRTAALVWEGVDYEGEVTAEQVPPQSFTRAAFALAPAPTFTAVSEAGSVSTRIEYSDLAGNIWASTFRLVPAPEIGAHDWKVGALSFHTAGEPTPWPPARLKRPLIVRVSSPRRSLRSAMTVAR